MYKLSIITLYYIIIQVVHSFSYGQEKVRGVNLGGWLVLEPWITPSLFKQFEGKPKGGNDEWDFCEALGPSEAANQLRRHWDTWVTESDIARLAAAGINHIRIPIGYWAFDKKDYEPYVMGQFDYLVKGVQWAKNHNLRVVIDIHGAPGSQNGFDNSGKRGNINFFEKEENIERMVRIISRLAQTFSQPEFAGTVASIELVNEPAGWQLDLNRLKKFYQDGYNEVRKYSKDIIVMVHDAFKPLNEWSYLRNSSTDNIIVDTHIYQVFEYGLVSMSKEQHLRQPCGRISDIGQSNQKLWTVVGEWSLATTDCTKWLNGFNRGARYDGTLDQGKGPACPGCTCMNKDELSTYTPDHHQFLRQFAAQQIAVYEGAGSGWFFWNFKAEKSPEWDFLLAVDNGWINLKQPINHTC